MADPVIRTSGLSKVFHSRGRDQLAVDRLDLEVGRGGVHGFLGPNGSGKTTTLRMLLGLARPTAGSIEVLGHPVPRELPAAMRGVGAVVEQPNFFPGFSGRRNLELLARTGGAPRFRVVEVLEQVGLEPRADDRFKTYSLGMRQRLAIAATLLREPTLLILDEPTNGLDPQGIRDIRHMIRALGRTGVTVLLSSHLLSEVEQVCDSVSIVNYGRLVRSGSVVDVVSKRGARQVRVRVADPDRAYAVLADANFAVHREGTNLLVDSPGDPAVITHVLAETGLYVSELSRIGVDLESAFLELVGPDRHGAPV